MSKFTFDVFISYSHADAGWVKTWLLPRLEAAGLRVCIDYRDFKLGIPSLDNMTDAAVRSHKTLFVMTPNWTVSEFGQFEALVTQTIDPVGRGGRLLPLMLKDCDLPARLRLLTHADFRDPSNREAELARIVADICEAPGPALAAASCLAASLVHPYPLQANFTGRDEERGELAAWLADEEHPVCALVAMGGMGKSALAWYWLKHDVLPDASPRTDGVMWWSFYEGESSFARFIDEALRYVSNQPVNPQLYPTTYDRAQELRRLLQTRRVLFVLDGFERQLRAYARLDAVYQQDDDADPSSEARACVDPVAARWLSAIAAGATRAKVLLTTRLMPSDLEDRAGCALAGALKRELKELPRDDAVAFIRAQGVTKGTAAEIAAVCGEYGNHPLSLRLLSGLIARDARTPGDIAAAPRHDVHADLVQRQHHVLERSYNALPEKGRTLLSRIAAFRSPMVYDALAVFNEFADEAKFDAALDDLQARGLVQRDMSRNRYDLHPIVRHYAYDRLADKTGVHTNLRDYFAKIPAPDVGKAQTIEDLASVIELYHHTVRAERYDQACDLYYERIWETLYYRFGAYQTQIELLRGLFPGGENSQPLLSQESDQAWTLNELANAYSLSGRSRRAAPLFEQHNAIYEKVSYRENLITGLRNLASMAQLSLGELAAAEGNLERAIGLSREIKDEAAEATSRQELGRLLAYCGACARAKAELQTAQDIFDKHGPGKANYTSMVNAYLALNALLTGDPPAALTYALHARILADEVARMRYPHERDFIQAEWLLGAALMLAGKEAHAAPHLAEALTRCRRINLVELEPDILLVLARWHGARGEAREAWAHAEEALDIADRCEFRLKQAEAHNFLARLALGAGQRAEAQRRAESAAERAYCDGPPHCYRPALEEAERVLTEVRAKE